MSAAEEFKIDDKPAARGRGLAFCRPGGLVVTGPTVHASGSAVASGELGNLVSLAAWWKLSGRGAMLATGPEGSARGDALASGNLGSIDVVGPTGHASGAAVGTGELGSIRIEAEEFHRFGRTRTFTSRRFGSGGPDPVTLVQRTASTAATLEYDSGGGANSGVIASEPVLWLDLLVSNSGENNLYVMVFDADTVPANGATPIRQPILLGGPGGQTFLDAGVLGADGISGRPTTQGLVWCASTTPDTLTIDGSSSIWATAHYVIGGT